MDDLDVRFEFDGIAKRQPALKWIDIEHIDRHVDFGNVEPDFGENEPEDFDHDDAGPNEDHDQGALDFGDDDLHDDGP